MKLLSNRNGKRPSMKSLAKSCYKVDSKKKGVGPDYGIIESSMIAITKDCIDNWTRFPRKAIPCREEYAKSNCVWCERNGSGKYWSVLLYAENDEAASKWKSPIVCCIYQRKNTERARARLCRFSVLSFISHALELCPGKCNFFVHSFRAPQLPGLTYIKNIKLLRVAVCEFALDFLSNSRIRVCIEKSDSEQRGEFAQRRYKEFE